MYGLEPRVESVASVCSRGQGRGNDLVFVVASNREASLMPPVVPNEFESFVELVEFGLAGESAGQQVV